MKLYLNRTEERVLQLISMTEPDTPGQFEMCRMLGIARSNLIKSLTELKRRGLIRGEDKGNGTYGGRRWMIVEPRTAPEQMQQPVNSKSIDA